MNYETCKDILTAKVSKSKSKQYLQPLLMGIHVTRKHKDSRENISIVSYIMSKHKLHYPAISFIITVFGFFWNFLFMILLSQ